MANAMIKYLSTLLLSKKLILKNVTIMNLNKTLKLNLYYLVRLEVKFKLRTLRYETSTALGLNAKQIGF